MAITKRQACAYCGSTAVERTKGHVFAKAMQPTNKDPRIQWPVVPECLTCKAIWEDAENQFRNIVVMASKEGNPAAREQWREKITSSFTKPSGRRWFNDLYAQLEEVQIDGRPRHVVYPAKDPSVMLVVRKIVRGLCHYHGLGTAIDDGRVFAYIQRFSIPEEFRDHFVEVNLCEDFCTYYYCDLSASTRITSQDFFLRQRRYSTKPGVAVAHSGEEVAFGIPTPKELQRLAIDTRAPTPSA